MTSIRALPLLMLLSLPLAACGDGIYGCDLRDPMRTEQRCQERTAPVATPEATFEATCEASGGDYLADGCPRTDAVGACEIDAGTEDVLDIYYAPMTAAEVEQICMQEDLTFVANP